MGWIGGMRNCLPKYFRYSQECIKWGDFLLLLEGQTVNLPCPKNQFLSDLTVSRDNKIPFFATWKSPIEYIAKYSLRDHLETGMMFSRWKVFCFKNKISLEKNRNLPRCSNCFVKLIMQGCNMDWSFVNVVIWTCFSFISWISHVTTRLEHVSNTSHYSRKGNHRISTRHTRHNYFYIKKVYYFIYIKIFCDKCDVLNSYEFPL